jgi:hypothetical protein
LAQEKRNTVHDEVWIGRIIGWILSPGVPGIFYFSSAWLTMLGYSLHVYVGLILSAALLFICFLAQLGYKRQNVATFGNSIGNSAVYILILFFSTILMGSVGMAGISYGVHELGRASYATAQPLSIWSLTHHYLWHLVDMIPGVKTWEILGIPDPLTAADFTSRLLVTLFRALLVIPFLTLLKALLQLSAEEG